MIDQIPSFLSDPDIRLLLFGGKGGVGKTTAAAAIALYLADRDPRRTILVTSTDPAHSLADSLDQPLGNEIKPVEGVPGLFALEMDASRLLEEFNRRYGDVLKTIADRGTYFDREDIAQFFDLSLPGLDELMAIIEIADIVRKRQYDLVILDTAPTGHTLRLLELPQLLEDWLRILDMMMAKHRYMASVFARYRPDETDAFIQHMSADLGHLRVLLSDASRTEFVPVTIPEAMSVEETSKLLGHLTSLNLHVRTIVVNRVVTESECPFCVARQKGQQRYLHEIGSRFAGQQIVQVPLLPREVRGQAALKGYMQALLGHKPDLSFFALSPGGPGPERREREQEGRHNECTTSTCREQRIVLAPRQLLLFGGKGGVGKTTIAAATALYLARQDGAKKTLLFSIDPAHSLSDSLDQPIGNQITPIAGVDGLFALEIESTGLLEELKQQYINEINEVFDAFLGRSFDTPYDRRVMEELISLTPPGVDELMALIKVMELMDTATSGAADAVAFDYYVLDMAPTGHALRFLELPGLMRQWFIAFFRLLLKYQGVVTLSQVAMLLRDKSKQLRRVEQLLVDAQRCEFIAVTIPEAMAVLETDRLLKHLAQYSVTCRWVVANMVVPPTDCAFCVTMRDEQQRYLNELGTLAPNLIQVPLFPGEVRGIAGLAQIADMIYGEGHG